MASATVTLMLALNWGGVRYPWISAPIVTLIMVSALMWVLFVVRLRTATEPLIPADVLANQFVALGTLSASFGMGVFIGLTIYVPIYLELVYRLTASQSGLCLIPLMVGTVTGATISGRIMARVRHYKRVPVVGLMVAVAALAVVAALPRQMPLPMFEVFLAATSMGLGALLPVTTVAIQNAVMPHQMGTATGTMNFFRSLGGALIVAGFGAILLGGLPQSIVVGVSMESLSSAMSQTGLDIVTVFRWLFAAAGLGLTVALASLLIMEERPLKSRIHHAPSPE
jgi:MFS family permease